VLLALLALSTFVVRRRKASGGARR
jgi:hypothetical protein